MSTEDIGKLVDALTQRKVQRHIDGILNGLLEMAKEQQPETANYFLFRDPKRYSWFGYAETVPKRKYYLIWISDSDKNLYSIFFDDESRKCKTVRMKEA